MSKMIFNRNEHGIHVLMNHVANMISNVRKNTQSVLNVALSILWAVLSNTYAPHRISPFVEKADRFIINSSLLQF